MAVRLVCRALLLARGPAETRDAVFRDRVSDGAVLEDRRKALCLVPPFRWALAMIVGSGFLTEIHGEGDRGLEPAITSTGGLGEPRSSRRTRQRGSWPPRPRRRRGPCSPAQRIR